VSSRFFFFLSIRGFALEPSRLCRHPSIRTLCGAIVARCKLGVLDSVGAATCESTSVPPFRRERVQDLSQSPDLGGRARLFWIPSLFLLFCSCFFLPAFPSFSQRNFQPGSPSNDDRQLRRPLASPVLGGAVPSRPRRASLGGYCAVVRTPLHLPTTDAAAPPAFSPPQ
jgi:hypothetical protein